MRIRANPGLVLPLIAVVAIVAILALVVWITVGTMTVPPDQPLLSVVTSAPPR